MHAQYCQKHAHMRIVPQDRPRRLRVALTINSLSLPAEFRWSSLQFNKNTVARPHTDRNNEGLSLVIVVGDYTGGSLVVLGRRITTPSGRSPINVFIDGRETHLSEAFEGERFSIVAFVHDSARCLSVVQKRQLETLGFKPPVSSKSKVPSEAIH